MIAELALPNNNSTNNNIRLIQQKEPKLKSVLLRLSNRYLELKRRFREGEVQRPAANKIIREVYMPELLKADPDEAPVVREENDNLDPLVRISQDKSELDRFNPTQSALMKELGEKGHAMAYAPIFPLCDPYLIRDKLTARGVKNSVFQSNTILDRQLVVGITNEELMRKINAYKDLSDGCNELKSLGKAADKVSKDEFKYYEAIKAMKSFALGIVSQLDKVASVAALGAELRALKFSSQKPETFDPVIKAIWAIAEELKDMRDSYDGPVTAEKIYENTIKSVSRMMGKKLIPVAKPHLALKASWLWLISEKELNAIIGCGLGGHTAIKKWGLAFSK
jgi:hypothetical protein